jgi:NAD(P)-dependent dehydrogenase (short-subunit alcohol dehydrogenase family)
MGKVAIVTGSSRGIGAAIAKALAREGFDVCVNYQSDADSAKAVAGAIEQAGRKAVTVRADMGSEQDIVAMFETVDEQLGSVDLLVNNAGITGRRCLIEEIDAETLEAVFRVNIAGYFLCAREAIRRMSTQRGGRGGNIVNVSSVASLLSNAFDWVHYGASKGAIDTLTLGLALETSEHGIRCNGVRPGMVATDINPQDRIDRISPTIPMRRVAEPEEIAEAVVWFASEKASYCTGTTLNVSGGRQ